MIEAQELARRALIAGAWVGPVEANISSMDLEQEIEIPQNSTISTYAIEGTEVDQLDLPAAGSSFDVASYWGESCEWSEYYWNEINEALCGLEDLFSHQISLIEDATMESLEVLSAQLLALSSIYPFQLSTPLSLLEFCLYNNLQAYLNLAMEIIKLCFPSVREISLYLESDPDTDEEWLLLSFPIEGEIEEVLEQYDRYAEIWTSYVPWPEREKIRISYDIV